VFGGSWVVVEHEMAADRGDSRREPDAEAPPREIDLVHALVAEVSIAGIPDPVPVVVKAVVRERLEWRRPGPQVVIDPARNRFHRRSPDRVASLEAQPARQVDAAERAVVKMPDRVDRGACGTELPAVLHDAAVLFSGTHQLPALPEIVRARLLDVDVLACLARPNRHQRMPMVRRGDRDRIDRPRGQRSAERLPHVCAA